VSPRRWGQRASLLCSLALATGSSACVREGRGAASRTAHEPSTAGAHADPEVWQRQVLYLVLPDRFADGDRSNDDAGQPGCFDPRGPSMFHGGDLAGLRQRLGYLKDLGATALWITPLPAQVPRRQDSCGYHGYWADLAVPDDGAMEPKLGTVADAVALAGDLHASGMKLVLDLVVNHAGRGARIAAQRPSWFHDEATCKELGDPIVFCSLKGLPDFRQEDPAVASYLTASSRGWMSRIPADGIRMDTAKHVPVGYFADSFVPGVRAVRGDAFLVAEYFDTGPVAQLDPLFHAGFDSAFHFPLRSALIQAFAQAESVSHVADAVASTIATLGEDRARMLVTFLDNHDVPRFLSDASASAGDDAALAARYTLALTSLFTLPGIPQIYSGDELAAVGVYPDNRRDMPEWAWDAATRRGPHAGYVGDGQATWSLVQSLAKLRHDEPALWKGAYAELRRDAPGGPNVLAFLRSSGASRVLVVLNDDPKPIGPMRVPLQAWGDGTVLEEVLHRGAPETIAVARGEVSLELPALTAGVYRAR